MRPVPLTQLAEQLVLPRNSPRLLEEIRVASLAHFERARQFDRLRLDAAARLLPGVAIGALVFRAGLAVPFVLSAAILYAADPWRGLALHHPVAPCGPAAACRCGALVCPVPLTPLAESLVLPRTSRRLLEEIRVASLAHFERARQFDRLRLDAAALLLPGAAIGVLVFRPGLVVLFVLSAAILYAADPWRGFAVHHRDLGDCLFALGRELYRSGPHVTPARLCVLQVRLDLLVATPASGWRQLVAGRVARGLSALCLRHGRGRGAAGQVLR